MEIARLPAEAVRPLRHDVLRPHQRPEDLVYEGDDLDGAAHLAALVDGAIVGVASISPEPHPRAPRAGDWRLRGMATRPEVRGRGAGAALLRAALDHARAHGAHRVWCNARLPVVGFYEREGFAVEGDVFELRGIGPHVVMSLGLR